MADVARSAPELTYGVVRFECRDTRNLPEEEFPSESVDLVVTSPPYGNANDYHLYHRFRLFWLGADPRLLAAMEIGSHLRHQKESTAYSSYRDELLLCTKQISRLLRPGRFVPHCNKCLQAIRISLPLQPSPSFLSSPQR